MCVSLCDACLASASTASTLPSASTPPSAATCDLQHPRRDITAPVLEFRGSKKAVLFVWKPVGRGLLRGLQWDGRDPPVQPEGQPTRPSLAGDRAWCNERYIMIHTTLALGGREHQRTMIKLKNVLHAFVDEGHASKHLFDRARPMVRRGAPEESWP